MKEEFDFGTELMAALLQRSYHAVDGLWFMMLEKETDFETALRIDKAVWSVLPKVQVKKIKELTGISGSPFAKDFLPVLKIKFALDNYDYQVLECMPERIKIKVIGCPWVELLRRSERLHLADKIGKEICPLDLGGWAGAFHPSLKLTNLESNCSKLSSCVFCIESSKRSGISK